VVILEYRNLGNGDFEKLSDLLKTVMKNDSYAFRYDVVSSSSEFANLFQHKLDGINSGNVIDIVACENKEIIGECEIVKDGYSGKLGILLNNDYKHMGIGSGILQFAISKAKEIGIKYVLAETVRENKIAISFFKKNNFSVKAGSKTTTVLGAII
jgi:ribosomal protein S18 acetylase RimI-like enzyme